MAVRRAQIRSVGHALPNQIITNDDLAQRVETSDAWIKARTGISERRFAQEGETTSTLGIAASTMALERAGLTGNDIDLVICATTTPDLTFPATAVRIQKGIGMSGGAAFDVQAVCSGFIYALSVADNFIRAGQAQRVLVVGSETFSRLLDFEDRTTCVLFGDGAGVVLLEAVEVEGTYADRCIFSTHIFADGTKEDCLYVDGGPSTTQTVGFVRMKGQEVFRNAIENLSEAVKIALETNQLGPDDIDWFVPHQANQRIIDGVARKLKIAPEKVISTVAHHANTSSASIPLALATAVDDGRIKQGDMVLFEAMGGGFTWGSALVRF